MHHVRAVQRIRVEKNRDGVIEADAVLLCVGLGLPRVPLEHNLVYTEWHPDLALAGMLMSSAISSAIGTIRPANAGNRRHWTEKPLSR